jgi:hypothetical protein
MSLKQNEKIPNGIHTGELNKRNGLGVAEVKGLGV